MKQGRRWRQVTPNGVKNPIVSALFELASDSLVYLVGAAVIGLGNLVVVPLYTHHLSPTEFGVYALVDVTILIVVTTAQLGLGVSYLKWFADSETSHQELLGSTLIVGGLAALASGSVLALILLSSVGEEWLQTADRGFVWTILPMVVLESVQGLLLTDLRASRRAVAFSVSTVVRLLGIVVASLWFIVVQDQRVEGVFLGRLAGDVAGILMLVAFCLPVVTLRLRRSLIGPMVSYGLPLVWSSLVAIMLDASGRYFLSRYATLEQVGYYGIGSKIANILLVLIAQPFGIAWGGLLFQIVRWPNARIIYSRIFSYVFIISMVTGLIMTLFTSALFDVFATPNYAPAMSVFPMLVLVQAVRILEYPAAIGIYLQNKTSRFALIYSTGLGINLAMNFLLVSRYGMFGASIGWVLGWTVIVGLMAWFSQRYYPLDYDWKPFFLILVIWGFVLGSRVVFSGPSGLTLAIATSVLILAGTGSYLRYDLSRTGIS